MWDCCIASRVGRLCALSSDYTDSAPILKVKKGHCGFVVYDYYYITNYEMSNTRLRNTQLCILWKSVAEILMP
jgi:hypothetical protein